MSRKTFNIVLTVITVLSLIAAFGLTSMSVQISRNKATNIAKEDILGTWTDTTNPQMIIQFTSENEYKVMGEVRATYSLDPSNSILTLNYTAAAGGQVANYNYAFSTNHSQLSLTNIATGETVLYSR